MKKFLCILVLACVVMGGAFAQAAKPAASNASSGAKNAIGWDVFRMFDGLLSFNDGDLIGPTFSFSYERLLVPHWSLGPNLDLGFAGYTGLFHFTLGVSAEGRYYPLADFEKLFLGAALGFTVTANSYSGGYYYDPNYGVGYYGSGYYLGTGADFRLTVLLKLGYKVITSKKFYLEPSLSYLAGFNSVSGGGNFQGGLRLGFAF